MIPAILLITSFLASSLSFFVAKTITQLKWIAVTSTLVLLGGTGILAFAPTLGTVDKASILLLFLLSFGGFTASIYAAAYLRHEMEHGVIGYNRARKLYAQLHMFLFAMSLAIVTTNPIVAWIAVEATTLTTAFLISFYAKPSAMEAAWKYLILNSVGLLLAFFGTLLFLTPELTTAIPGLATWHGLLQNSSSYTPFIIKMGFVFVLIGYGTKVGLVPMHTWLPDAHSMAPSPISSLLSGVLLNVPLLIILRFKTITDAAVGPEFASGLLIAFGLISLVTASAIILVQKNYKRLLAYSSIEHMGIAALGFGIGGAATAAALLHMIYHSLTKSLLFLSSGNIFLSYRSTIIHDVRGLVSRLPATAALFFIGVLTIIGMPPGGIFFTEFAILEAGLSRHLPVVILALAALLIAGIGFIRHLAALSFGETDKTSAFREDGSTLLPLALLFIVIAILSIALPTGISSYIMEAAASL